MFLMSQGPSFEVNSRCEMGVLCLSWYGLPLCIKKPKVCLARKSQPECDSEALSFRTFTGKGNFQNTFLTLAPIQSAACVCQSHDSLFIFFLCLPSYSALIFEVFNVINLSVFAGLHLLTVVSGQLFPSFQWTVLLPFLSFHTYSLPICSAFWVFVPFFF